MRLTKQFRVEFPENFSSKKKDSIFHRWHSTLASTHSLQFIDGEVVEVASCQSEVMASQPPRMVPQAAPRAQQRGEPVQLQQRALNIEILKLISQLIKGCKEKFFIKPNFRQKNKTSSSGQKFFGKKCFGKNLKAYDRGRAWLGPQKLGLAVGAQFYLGDLEYFCAFRNKMIINSIDTKALSEVCFSLAVMI